MSQTRTSERGYKAAAFALGFQHALEDAGLSKAAVAAMTPSPYVKQTSSANTENTNPYTKTMTSNNSWTRGNVATASPTPQSQTAIQPPPTTPLRETPAETQTLGTKTPAIESSAK